MSVVCLFLTCPVLKNSAFLISSLRLLPILPDINESEIISPIPDEFVTTLYFETRETKTKKLKNQIFSSFNKIEKCVTKNLVTFFVVVFGQIRYYGLDRSFSSFAKH